MDKTCSNGECRYRYQGTGTIGWGCSYTGYCDFQRPLDSRFVPLIELNKKWCLCAGQVDTTGNCSVCDLPK